MFNLKDRTVWPSAGAAGPVNANISLGKVERAGEGHASPPDAARPLSLRNVEDLLHERGIDVCHEITKERDKAAALKFIKKAMNRHGRTKANVTDGLRSYGAALKEMGAEHLQESGR